MRNDGWAVAEAGYLTGQLEIAAGALNGGVTEVTEYVDGATDHQQVRFDGVAFDEAAAASDEPPFGAISAEWDSPQYPRKGATISFP